MFSWLIAIKNDDSCTKDYSVCKTEKVANLEKPREKKRSIFSILSNLVGLNLETSSQDTKSISENRKSNLSDWNENQEDSNLSDWNEEVKYFECFYPMDFEVFDEMDKYILKDMELNWS